MTGGQTNPRPGSKPRRARDSFRGVQIEYVVGELSNQKDIQSVLIDVNSSAPPDCRPLQNLQPGEAAFAKIEGSSGPRTIYCRAPVLGVDEPGSELLAACYRNALRLADRQSIESIALPAISTGPAGHPFIETTETACRTILESIPSLNQLKRIRLVFRSSRSANIAYTLMSQQIRLRV